MAGKAVAGLVIGSVLASACAEGGARHATVEARDSAGIRIVENRLSADASSVQRLDSEPLFQIGVIEGAPEYQLDRVQWLTRLSDGTIVVANGGTSEIRYYDADGRHVRTSGRVGAGPGEYRAITYMRRLAGDTVLVHDAFNRRLSYLDASGAHVRDEPLAGDRPLRIAAALEDGTLLSTSGPPPPPSNSEFVRDTATYEIVRADDRRPIERRYAGSERRVRISEQGGNIIGFQMMLLPFARNVLASAGRDHFVIASNYTYELHVIDADGAVRTIARRTDVSPQPVTTELIDRFVDVQVAQARAAGRDADEAASRRLAHSYYRVEAVPAFERILAGQDGTIWVQEWAPPAADRAADRWSVFASDGVLRGGIDVPAGYRPLYVDDEVVIGVIRDEYDVEYVWAYALRL